MKKLLFFLLLLVQINVPNSDAQIVRQFFTSATSNKPVHVVIITGQSNAAGLAPQTQLTSNLLQPFPQVMIYYPQRHQWEAYQVGVNELGLNGAVLASLGAPGYDDGFGPDLGFAIQWTANHPNGEKVYLIKNDADAPITSTAGSSIALWNSTLWPGFKTVYDSAKYKLVYTLHKQIDRQDLIWVQGESESGGTAYADTYDLMENKFRTFCVGIDGLIVIVATGNSTVRAAQLQLVNDHPFNYRYVETSQYVPGGFLGDNTHYGKNAMLGIGHDSYYQLFP